MRRVREVDDDTLDALLDELLQLRRTKAVFTGAFFIGGAFITGVPNFSHGLVSLLVYGTLACAMGLPAMAVGSLSVRRLFLRSAQRSGLSKSAAMLAFTRAERRARTLRPFSRREDARKLLHDAVRDPDRAD